MIGEPQTTLYPLDGRLIDDNALTNGRTWIDSTTLYFGEESWAGAPCCNAGQRYAIRKVLLLARKKRPTLGH